MCPARPGNLFPLFRFNHLIESSYSALCTLHIAIWAATILELGGPQQRPKVAPKDTFSGFRVTRPPVCLQVVWPLQVPYITFVICYHGPPGPINPLKFQPAVAAGATHHDLASNSNPLPYFLPNILEIPRSPPNPIRFFVSSHFAQNRVWTHKTPRGAESSFHHRKSPAGSTRPLSSPDRYLTLTTTTRLNLGLGRRVLC